MRDPNRIEKMLCTLRDVWTTYPDMRLGQLIHNVQPLHGDLFYVEDDQMEKHLKRFAEEHPGL